jgi:hypothetical protein
MVCDSRARDAGAAIRRRRRCGACGHRWRTIEVPGELLDADYAILRQLDRLDAVTRAAVMLLIRRLVAAMAPAVEAGPAPRDQASP